MKRGWLIGGIGLVLVCLLVFLLIPAKVGPEPLNRGGDLPISVKESDGPKVQNWSAGDRRDFYHLAEGSELYPLDWIKALISVKTGKPFLEQPERFGLIADPSDPDGLPMGVTGHESRGISFLGRMIGVNCAACHCTQITYQGKSLILDGGPNQFDLNNFYLELFSSVGATAKDPKELATFLERVEKVQGRSLTGGAKGMIEGLASVLRRQAQGISADEKSFADGASALFAKVNSDLAKDPSELLGLAKKDYIELRTKLKAANINAIDNIAQTLQSGDMATRVLNDIATKREEIRDSISDMALNAALIQARLEFLKKLAKMHTSESLIPGPGRIDAFGSIRDMVFPPVDYIPTTSPVSYPHLWQVGQTVWFHWDGNTNSLLQRNIGQSMGLGAVYDPKTNSSTVLPYELYRLDELTRRLTPPAWPAEMLGAIDTKKAERGRTLFAANCIKCHASPDKSTVEERERIVSLEEVKTDPTRVENYAIPVDRENGGKSFAVALSKAAAGFTDQSYIDNAVGKAEQAKMDLPPDQVAWRTNHGYVSRPLVACWGTSPYLHNGSVPTLYDLLQPAEKRPKSFVVGYREYDPIKLGYVSDRSKVPAELLARPPIMEYDATIKGNLNTGHEFGTSLSEGEKMDLLEFLKAS